LRLLIDNDVIHKLAAYDLLPSALHTFGGPDCACFVGPRTRFSMFVRKNREKGKSRYGAEVHARIVEFVESTRMVTEQAHVEDLASMSGVLGLDPGEGLLFAAAARDQDAFVATGDRRSIEALASAPSCSGIVGRLLGRVVLLEHFLLAAIRDLGFETVKTRVLPGVTVDTGIHAWAFGSGPKADEATACAGLRSRIEDLRPRSAGMIYT
jgi:hypothetical protein